MSIVRPKKYLGQHFLKDQNIAMKIVNSIQNLSADTVIEIGPGTGMLTQFLTKKVQPSRLLLIEIDPESVEYLKQHYPGLKEQVIEGDFLQYDLSKFNDITLTGNFPYNISSQIFFKVLENYDKVGEVVCMIQKEVAERIASPGNEKSYGILSVLLQAYYDISYIFTVNESVFAPPPKVKSAVISFQRKKTLPDVNYKNFRLLVKAAFNQRRKMLRNSLKTLFDLDTVPADFLVKRPEQINVEEFISLGNIVKRK